MAAGVLFWAAILAVAVDTTYGLDSDVEVPIDGLPQHSEGVLPAGGLSAASIPLPQNNTQVKPAWGLDRIDQHFLPLDGFYHYSSLGSNVNVYVVNTGIDATHEDFGYMDGTPGTRVKAAYAFDGSDPLSDCFGYGTHAAGIVGGLTYGVAKNVTLHSVKVFNCTGSTPVLDILTSLAWVADNHVKPALVLWLTYPQNNNANQVKNAAVQSLVDLGLPVVVGAGTQGKNACELSPANSPVAITVSGTAPNDTLQPATLSFQASNTGPCVALFAPALNIPSAWIGAADATQTMSGTNTGPSHVAGAVALLQAAMPAAAPSDITSALQTLSTKGILSGIADSPNQLLYMPGAGLTAADSGMSFSGTLYAMNMQFGANNTAESEDVENLIVAAFTQSLQQHLNATGFVVQPANVVVDEVVPVEDGKDTGASYFVRVKASAGFVGPVSVSLTGDLQDFHGNPLQSSIAPLVFSILPKDIFVATAAHDL